MTLPVEPKVSSRDSMSSVVTALQRAGYRMAAILERIDFDYRAWTCGLGMDIPLLFKRRDQCFAKQDTDSLDTLIRLLFFGGSTKLTQLENIFSTEELRSLEAMKLVVPAALGEVICPYGFYEIEGLFVVTDRELLPKAGVSRIMPLFPETYEFATARVRKRGGRVVDMGTGSGVHALLTGLYAETVLGIDINPRAVAFANFNKALNRADNVEFRLGDLYQGLEGQRFDLLTMAPPYLPTEQLSHPIEASGGPRGDAVYSRVLEGLDDHLTDRGFAQFSTIMIDWEDAPFEQRTLDSIGKNVDHFDVVVLGNSFEFRPQILAERWNFNQVPPLLELFMRSYKEYGVLNLRRGGAGRYVHAPFVLPVTFQIEQVFEAMQNESPLEHLLGPTFTSKRIHAGNAR